LEKSHFTQVEDNLISRYISLSVTEKKDFLFPQTEFRKYFPYKLTKPIFLWNNFYFIFSSIFPKIQKK